MCKPAINMCIEKGKADADVYYAAWIYEVVVEVTDVVMKQFVNSRYTPQYTVFTLCKNVAT